MSPSTLPARQAFVETYSPSNYSDPWDATQDYKRVQRHLSEHPQQGSQAVSTALDLPRGRIRRWVNSNGMPDCYRGLQTALLNGWITDSWTNTAARTLNCLATWILSSGGINDAWTPTFIAEEGIECEALQGYAKIAGIYLDQIREPGESRPVEWRPSNDASVLGRVLYTWTRVKGDKSRRKTKFPEYLNDAPEYIIRDFSQIYVQQRGIYRDGGDGFIQINADRTESFRQAIKSCFQSVVSDPDEVRGEGWPIRVYGEAMETLRQYPDIGKTS